MKGILNHFHIMAKPIGPICNIDCTYCFYLEKSNLYPANKNFKMTDKLLQKFIHQMIQNQPGNHVQFAWQGGEPTLMGLDFFNRVVELQNELRGNKTVENILQTNGILLNDEWCDFFREKNFLIGISIDGPEFIHNKFRLDKIGKGTFERVMNGLENLKKHNVEFNTLTVVNDYNSKHPLTVYNFLKEIGSKFMQFIPIVELVDEKNEKMKIALPNNKNARVSDWSVRQGGYGDFLIKIFNSWISKDVGTYYIQIFDVALETWYGMVPSVCIFRETCGNALALEHNGDVYSCDHYVYSDYKIGNIEKEEISKMLLSEKQYNFGQNKLNKLPKYCLECDYKFVCNGGCPKNRIIKSPDGEDGLNYLCESYKKFFNHIDSSMQFMVNELKNNRPPANVMSWAKGIDKYL